MTVLTSKCAFLWLAHLEIAHLVSINLAQPRFDFLLCRCVGTKDILELAGRLCDFVCEGRKRRGSGEGRCLVCDESRPRSITRKGCLR